MIASVLDVALTHLPALLRGVGLTLVIAAIGVSGGLALGIAAGFARAYAVPVFAQACRIYMDTIRGTPLLVQILFLFFGLPSIVGCPIPPLAASIAAIMVNSGAYFGEVIRGAVEAIPRGQIEAARSLGLSWPGTIRHVVWPQAILLALPGLGNQLVTSLKDTSLLAVIGVEELTRNGQVIIAATFRAFEVWVLVALLYLVLTSVALLLLRRIEQVRARYACV